MSSVHHVYVLDRPLRGDAPGLLGLKRRDLDGPAEDAEGIVMRDAFDRAMKDRSIVAMFTLAPDEAFVPEPWVQQGIDTRGWVTIRREADAADPDAPQVQNEHLPADRRLGGGSTPKRVRKRPSARRVAMVSRQRRKSRSQG